MPSCSSSSDILRVFVPPCGISTHLACSSCQRYREKCDLGAEPPRNVLGTSSPSKAGDNVYGSLMQWDYWICMFLCSLFVYIRTDWLTDWLLCLFISSVTCSGAQDIWDRDGGGQWCINESDWNGGINYFFLNWNFGNRSSLVPNRVCLTYDLDGELFAYGWHGGTVFFTYLEMHLIYVKVFVMMTT